MKFSRTRLITLVLVLYVILAGSWWAYLLYSKNKEAFDAQKMVLWEQYKQEGGESKANFMNLKDYKALEKEYGQQRVMIITEGSVFLLILVFGLWMVYRGFRKEVAVARQQRNFLLSITHELKSPIASIRLVLETLLRRKLKPEQSEPLKSSALHETDRLQVLVENLLLAAKVENAYKMVKEELDLGFVLGEVVIDMQEKYPKANIVYEEHEEIILEADRDALFTIFINLLSNAIKYSPENPYVSLRAKQQGSRVIIEFADEGIGIPTKEKDQIFNKFYRIGNEDTRQTKGTGLGLYIVKKLVEVHNGKIFAVDNNPKGSIFRVMLPT